MSAPAVELELWSAAEPVPRARVPLPPEGLALTRSALGIEHDTRVSRGADAVELLAVGASNALLRVPEGAYVEPVVLAGVGLSNFQPVPGRWEVSPRGLDDAWALARSGSLTLGLLSGSRDGQSPERMHLFQIPEVQRVAPGSELGFSLPALVVIAGCALAVQAPETSAGVLLPGSLVCWGSFDLDPLRRALFKAEALEGAPQSELPPRLFIPGCELPLDRRGIQQELAQRLPEWSRWLTFPALDERGNAYLLLGVRDPEAGWWVLGSDRDPDLWVAELAAHAGVSGSRQSATPPAAVAGAGGYAAVSGGSWAGAAEKPVASHEPLALASPERFGEFTTYDATTADMLSALRAAAPTSLSVLLLGESGTGKELLAQALHRESKRRGAFVPINCAAIAANLIESELFGHTSSAYTGAQKQRAGAFVAASGGTLFLDEIGDAPMHVQLSLLRAIESGYVKPVGADREQHVDVRVIAATSRDLRQLLVEGHFREDLYNRLDQLVVRVPPLRERPADIERLAEDLLRGLAPARHFTPPAKRALLFYPWPGNVRKLKHTIERAVALGGSSGPLDVAELALDAGLPTARPPAYAGAAGVALPRPAALPEGLAGGGGQTGGGASTAGTDVSPQPNAARAPLRLAVPNELRALVDRAVRDGKMPRPETSSAQRARAQQRAAFIVLRLEQPHAPWSPELSSQFQRLFRPLWAQSEGGRNLTEAMTALGLNPTLPRDRARLSKWLEHAGIPTLGR